MFLKIDGADLKLNDLLEDEDHGLYPQLIEYIELKKETGSKGSVITIGPCDVCEHESCEHDLWKFPIWDHDARVFEYYDSWVRIMGEDVNFAQDEVYVYRCPYCSKWMIRSDG